LGKKRHKESGKKAERCERRAFSTAFKAGAVGRAEAEGGDARPGPGVRSVLKERRRGDLPVLIVAEAPPRRRAGVRVGTSLATRWANSLKLRIF
jgi:hypothetical protein